MFDLPYPPLSIAEGNEKELANQIYSYLLQLREAVSDSLNNIERENLSASFNNQMNEFQQLANNASKDANSALLSTGNIPRKVSELQNDAGYLTTEEDPTVSSWAKGSYNDIPFDDTIAQLGADTLKAAIEVLAQRTTQ